MSESVAPSLNDRPKVTHRGALIFHSQENHVGWDARGHGLVTWHPVEIEGRGIPVLGAGRLVSDGDVEAILRSLLKERWGKGGFLPPRVVSISPEHMAWVVRGRVSPMLFRLQGDNRLRSLRVPWPTLLLVASRSGRLHVAALRSSRRPTPGTRLYHAPLMNVSSDGAMCTGSATLPVGISVERLEEWERVVTDTAFSHVNFEGGLEGIRQNKRANVNRQHVRFWETLEKEQATTFPSCRLVPMGCSVGRFLRSAAGAF